jgi:pantetheine-phosphate adenylyltransferase
VYAGSFDPITLGHLWMVNEGARLFDNLVVAIGVNPHKNTTFTLEERVGMVRECVKSIHNVEVATFSNRYLIDYAGSVGATHILRGVRSVGDYEFERAMRHINDDLGSRISTVFLMPPRDIAEISSSMVKGLIGPSGWKKVLRKYVPAPVYKQLLKRHS